MPFQPAASKRGAPNLEQEKAQPFLEAAHEFLTDRNVKREPLFSFLLPELKTVPNSHEKATNFSCYNAPSER
jgi:hypothetical protein